MFVNFNILNQLGSPAINSNTFANRPAAGQTGRLFVSTDTFEIYRDNGTSWDLIGGPGTSTITGSGTATQVAYFTGTNAIGSSANLFWDNTNGFLGVGTATPGARIEAVKTDGYGIYANYTTSAGSGATTTGIYSINNTAGSGYAAVIEEKTGNTTGGQYPLLVKHSLSSGTAAAGMGTGLQFQLPDDAGTFKTTQLTIETTNAAAATYATRYRFNVQSNGSSTPVGYINATGLGLFTATPGAALDIHSTGTLAQFNSTGTTNNAYLAIQRTGATIWRLGDTYNSGSNFFGIYNSGISTNAIAILAATNKTEFTAVETYTTGVARANYFDYNLSVAAGGSFSSPNSISAVGATLDLTLAGNATIPSGSRSGLDAYNTVSFTGTGTLTHSQGTQIRAYSNLTTGWAFAGSATGTITHLAGLRVLFPDNSGSAVTITNNYGLLINDQTANTGTVTYTNRWGIYQEGASDTNYFAGTTLIGTTVNSGYKLDVSGNGRFTNTTALLYLNSTNTNGASAVFNTENGTDKWAFGNNLGTGDGAWSVYNFAASSRYLTLTSSGNLGLGVTPSAWSTFKAFELPNVGFLASAGEYIQMIANGVYNGTNYTYKTSNVATMYAQAVGQHQWFNAPSGTAGNTFAFTQAMTLTAAGNLGIGTTTPNISGGSSNTKTLTISAIASGANGILELNGTRVNSGDYSGYVRFFNNAAVTPIADIQAIRGANDTSGILAFATSASEAARITAGQNFLIGTTTDGGQKLQVNGTANFVNEVTINSSSSGVVGLTVRGYSGPGVKQNFLCEPSSGLYNFEIGTNISAINTFEIRPSTAADGTSFAVAFKLDKDGNQSTTGSIKTGAPSGGTAAVWKLGSYKAAAVTLNTANYIEVDIGGTLYKLAVVT